MSEPQDKSSEPPLTAEQANEELHRRAVGETQERKERRRTAAAVWINASYLIALLLFVVGLAIALSLMR